MRHVLLVAAALAVLALACGDSKGSTPGEGPFGDDGIVTSGAMVAPNTFMTHAGAKYRLSDTLQANLVDRAEFRKVGATREADIDFSGSLDVYERTGDADPLYTYSKGTGTGESAIPALWLRWVPGVD